jgi:hypothetical protein
MVGLNPKLKQHGDIVNLKFKHLLAVNNNNNIATDNNDIKCQNFH